ncbi:unnamed protein product [Protopolystoma xenopodis]|uniref:Uncharacterized protein n=1 Tax=Protopolystoma xenopodis TaxID=117903 RepID=A0A448WMW1_9PLAT|nr:unnamed protein product [Protopolystoma xenopodis]
MQEDRRVHALLTIAYAMQFVGSSNVHHIGRLYAQQLSSNPTSGSSSVRLLADWWVARSEKAELNVEDFETIGQTLSAIAPP